MKRLLQKIRPERLREIILLLLIAVVLIFFASVIERYLNARLFNRVSASVAIMSILAIAQTLVCLLYTSPSPRDGLLSRMPSSA